MGIDLSIENEPRIVVRGHIKDWRGERDLDGPMENWELSSLLEDPPEYAKLEVTREPLQPPLPDDLPVKHVGMPYSAFNRVRGKLAATLGLDLEMMWGFQPTATRIADLRAGGKVKTGGVADWDAFEREQIEWWETNARQWDTVDSGLVPLLHHSDCEGDLSPGDCRAVAPALAEAVKAMAPDGDRDAAVRLQALVEACGKYERRLLFR